MTNKEIEDYINTYRLYPDEYNGIKNNALLVNMNSQYYYDLETKTITRLEGRINDTGDFEIVGLFKFPVDRPDEKVEIQFIKNEKIHLIRRAYNILMEDLNCNDSIIAPGRDTEKWNLRDMVSEVEYIRSTYYDKNHPRGQLRETDPVHFKRHTYRLRHFIRRYRDDIKDIVATTKHNSKYD